LAAAARSATKTAQLLGSDPDTLASMLRELYQDMVVQGTNPFSGLVSRTINGVTPLKTREIDCSSTIVGLQKAFQKLLERTAGIPLLNTPWTLPRPGAFYFHQTGSRAGVGRNDPEAAT
jgi:hypothetical protein